MGQVDLANYKNIYLETAKEYINNISSSYLKLSANSQDNEAMNALHISSHSLKSQSQVMGFIKITDLCANLERVSSDILNKISSADDGFINLLKSSVDELSLEISKIEKTP
jgi:chemotaxis protein histidine kinase CheA